jgi:hypothetical protein
MHTNIYLQGIQQKRGAGMTLHEILNYSPFELQALGLNNLEMNPVQIHDKC